MLPRNPQLLGNARRLRREMTKEERKLWYGYLRYHPAKFYKQKIFGSYIVDFYCDTAKLAIELDGSQHFEPAGQQHDDQRTLYLQAQGILVLRFSNTDITRHLEAVCAQIDDTIDRRIHPAASSIRQARDNL